MLRKVNELGQKETIGYYSWNARTDVVAKERITYGIGKNGVSILA